MMFHIGKIARVIKAGKSSSADSSVQAAVRMWDDNLMILAVHDKIAGKVKEGDYVIADYSPIVPESMNRKMLIIKVLDAKTGKQLYSIFTKEFERKRHENMTRQQQAPHMPYM